MKTLLYILGFILTLIGLITNILYINLLYPDLYHHINPD